MQNKFATLLSGTFQRPTFAELMLWHDDNGTPIASLPLTEYQVYEPTLGDPVIILKSQTCIETVKFQWLKDGVEIATTQELNFIWKCRSFYQFILFPIQIVSREVT
jgi:hypothetical protein